MPLTYSLDASVPSSRARIPLLPRLLMSALALGFLGAGIGLFIQHAIILRTWKPVEATVVLSDVIHFHNNKQRDMFRGEVELAYTIEGQTYHTPETFSYASSSETSIRHRMETTYAPGTHHRVFYDPANPHSLRWNVGINASFFLLPLVFTGVGLILVGVCGFLWRLPFPQRLHCTRCGNEGRIDDRFCPRCGDALAPVASDSNLQPAAAQGEDAEADDDDFETPCPPPRRENPTALLLVGAFFGLPGVACLIGAVCMGVNTYAATQTWPTANATVTRAIVETARSGDGTPTYRLAVEFDYERDQHPEHAAGQSIYVSGSYPWIVKRLERFAEGSRHSIRVNPRDPSDIRFDIESSLLNWMPTAGLGLFGFIFAAIGAALLVWGLARRCPACRHQLPRGAAFCAGCGKSLVDGGKILS